jgi:hypothetical protein
MTRPASTELARAKRPRRGYPMCTWCLCTFGRAPCRPGFAGAASESNRRLRTTSVDRGPVIMALMQNRLVFPGLHEIRVLADARYLRSSVYLMTHGKTNTGK